MKKILAFISGILLTLCFPDVSWGFLIWIALLPLLQALHQAKSSGEALKLGFICGFTFFSVSIHWLTNVTAFGWIFLTLLETFSMMLFSWLVYKGRNIAHSLAKALWIASAWILAEFIRSEMPIFGFGWNLLAYSQSDYLWVIQVANTIGAYGLGFVIVFVNACAFNVIARSTEGATKQSGFSATKIGGSADNFGGKTRLLRRFAPRNDALIYLLLSFVLLAAHGFYHLNQKPNADREVRISVIQGNVPQIIKWEPEAQDPIIELYSELTKLASLDHPELIIWPEASFPGYFNRDIRRETIQNQVEELGIPLVVGSPHLEENLEAFNSAYLIGANGESKSRYDKRYLVPFGEYVPLKAVFGFLEPMAQSLGVSDFSPGHQPTVFSILNGDLKFSTLICFEDIFPALSRTFVDAGASVLGVITNDAWFGKTAAPHQHLQASIFRAVENGVPVVRAANTGVSAFISSKGKVLGKVENTAGESTFIAGQKTMSIPFEDKPRKTVYRQGGRIFPYAVGVGFVIMAIIRKKSRR